MKDNERLRRAADAEVFAPVRGGGGVGIHAGLLGIRLLEQRQQPFDLRIIFLLGLLDSPLGEIVAQDVLRIHAIHANPALFVATLLAL